jgi:hypothetical protein
LAGAALHTARFVVAAVDSGFSELMAAIALEKDKTPFKADREQRRDLEAAWADYLKTKGADLPPGMIVLILCLTIYGPKTKLMIDQRRHNLQMQEKEMLLEEKQREIERLNRRLASLRKQEDTLNQTQP